MASESTPLLPLGPSRRPGSLLAFVRNHLSAPLDSSVVTLPLLVQCFISGLADATTFVSSQTWIGFMTGNLVQLGIALFNLPTSRARVYNSTAAVLGFSVGCLVAGRLTERLGAQHRGKFIAMALLRLAVTATIAGLGVRLDGDHAWTILALLAMSMGVQSSFASSLGTPFATTVVFTATLTNVTSDLHHLASNRSQQLRALGLLCLLSGAVVSQCFIHYTPGAGRWALVALAVAELALASLWATAGIKQSWRERNKPAQAHD